MLRLAALVCWLAGCDKVLGLHVVDVPDARPECPMSRLEPDLDEDLDSELNGMDPCPRVANQTTNDEDGDGTVDDCDPCAQIASAADTGGDPDCDGLGAACDPDPALLNERRFHGFGPGSDVAFDDPANDGVVRDGGVHMLLGDGSTTSTVQFIRPAPFEGHYELSGSITNVPSSPYVSIRILLRTAGDAQRYELGVFKGSSGVLSAAADYNKAELPGTRQVVASQAPQSIQFYIRADIVNGTLGGVVRVNDTTVTIPASPIAAPVLAPTYGFELFRERVTGTFSEAVAEYFVYTTLRP
jgi:hypothetical protein